MTWGTWEEWRSALEPIVTVLVIPVMSLLISYMKGQTWTQNQQRAFTWGVALIGGFLTSFVDGKISPTNVAGTITALYAGSTSFYNFWFKETDLNRTLEGKKVL